MCQTEVLSEVHVQGIKPGYPSTDLSDREPLLVLTSVPEYEPIKDAGQINRITRTEQMTALKAGDRVALGKGDSRVYTIGTVMKAAEDSEISIRYDFVNPVGVAVNHLDQGHRVLTQQEFDMIFIKLVRGY